MKDPKSKPVLRLVPAEVTIYDRSPLGSAFVETFIWEPTSQTEKSLGSLFVVGQIYSSRKRKENVALLTALSTIIKDEYYRNPEREAFRSFKLALKRAGTTLKKSQHWREGSFKLNLTIVAVAPPRFFSARLGEGVLFLLREGDVHAIEASPPLIRNKNLPLPDQSFRTATEGLIRPNDTLLLASKEFYKINPQIARELVAKNELEDFVLKREKEFYNLGLITIGLSEETARPAQTSHPTDTIPDRRKPALARFGAVGRNIFLRRAAALGLVAILVLVLTVATLLAQKKSDSARTRAGELTEGMTVLQERIKALVELVNYAEAEVALGEWERKLAELNSLGVLKNEYLRWTKEFDEAASVVKRYEPVSTRLVLNLEGNTVGFDPQGFTGNETDLFLFAENTFYKFSLTKEVGSFTVLPKLARYETLPIRDLALGTGETPEVTLLSNDFIGRYSNEFSLLVADRILSEATKIKIFKNAFYFLGENAIWRMEIGADAVEQWTQGRFFVKARDFAIDGFIYVLEEGKIQKLLNGTRQAELAVDSGVESIFTNTNLNNLYLLNPREGVVVVTDKLGNISRRLRHEELRGARDLIVAQDEKNLWFLKGQKVFSISL